MSRHRFPSGWRVPRGSAPVLHRTASRRGAPFAFSTQSALRNGVVAAAVAGGSLALVAPAVALMAVPDPDTDAAALRLAADHRRPTGDAVPAGYPGSGAGVPTTGYSDISDGALTAGYSDTGDRVRMLAAVVPVTQPVEPEPGQVDVAGLLKAAGLAAVAPHAEHERAVGPECDVDLSGLGAVTTWAADAARFLSCLYDRPHLIGVAGRGRVSDHPSGHAVDLMTGGERGDRLAECALRNQKALGISYVIWKQRINYGDGWEPMEDRGSPTENHFDHVHLSFEHSAPTGTASSALCH